MKNVTLTWVYFNVFCDNIYFCKFRFVFFTVKMRELEEMILGTVSSDKMSSNEYSLLKVNKLASNNSTTETITPSSENKVDCTVNQKSDANISKKNIYYSLITLLIHIYCRKYVQFLLFYLHF